VPENRIGKMLEYIKSNKIYEGKNPEVPLTLVYGSYIATPFSFEYKSSPLDQTKEIGSLTDVIKISGMGDETVENDNALTLPLKWAFEYDSKVANARPVEIVQLRSPDENQYLKIQEKQ